MKKTVIILCALSAVNVFATVSVVNFRTTSTQPLFYTLKDYTLEQSGIEFEAFYSKLYDPAHTNQAIILDQKNSLVFDQQGGGDLNPRWVNLLSINSAANYYSHVTFNPQMSQGGVLFHGYAESEHLYIDVRSALLETTTKVEIEEVGGGDGGLVYNITNAYQAFTQSDWNYGKIGDNQRVFGLDDIQIEVGTALKTNHFDIACFGLVQAPTGTGTLSQWLFEPLVGTNHWGLGFGVEAVSDIQSNFNVYLGANYRYVFKGWETRSFDLINNGAWSRYMLLQPTYSLGDPETQGSLTLGVPGINYMTQQALIEGRSQLNLYAVVQQKLADYLFKFGYNYYYFQAEKINTISQVNPGYGIYFVPNASGGVGGITTASTATINEAVTVPDLAPVDITTEMLDLTSGASGQISSNRFLVSLQKVTDTFVCGVGVNVDIALSQGASSTWAVWANFEYMFGKV